LSVRSVASRFAARTRSIRRWLVRVASMTASLWSDGRVWPVRQAIARELRGGYFTAFRIAVTNAGFPLALVGAMTALAGAVVKYSPVGFDAIVYLIPVMISAVRWGVVSAVVAAIASVAASDFFFLPPIYSFAVRDPGEIVNLALFLLVAIVTGNLAAQLRSQAHDAVRRENEISDLYLLSRHLAICSTAADLVAAIQEYLSSRLGARAFLIRRSDDNGGDDIAIISPTMSARLRSTASEMAAAQDASTRLIFDSELQNLWALRLMTTNAPDQGVLAICLGNHVVDATSEVNERIESILAEAAAALARIDAAAAFNNVNLRNRSEFLKSALIGSVSHELRSPIASILGSASVLDRIPSLREDPRVRGLVEGLHKEAKRLDNDIQNLLDTVRIVDTGIVPVMEWTDPGDVVAAAIQQCSHRLDDHRVLVDIDQATPLLMLDARLVEQAVGQILQNAAKYSPASTTISISVAPGPGEVMIGIADEGMGLMPGEEAQMFRRGFRGERQLGGIPGLGLGSWIAKIFVSANGGVVAARSRGLGLGTTITITFPLRANGYLGSDVEVR
jgi:K+-sensing histidine kinase KdpD